MAVSNSDGIVRVVCQLEDSRYTTEARRGQIVHEAFHGALPERLTVGHRLTFALSRGDEVFADNFIGDLIDVAGLTDELVLVTAAVPIPGHAGTWRNVG